MMVGVVKSNKCLKTITVEYEFSYRHPKYGKYMRKHGRVHAHDEKNEANPGDRVQIAFCRPYSKTKCWRLVKVLDRNPLAGEVVGAKV
ncbi:MAG: 30S ribosomal protein S17 [Phycisphaerales bacterium]|nr:30S ribosomal protein S17 [Phycisphaerales bacterium]